MILDSQNGKTVYSDGNETELNMLKIAQDYPGDLSQDYISNNSEYIINNTFSLVRNNILNWYPFLKDAELLEVGAGMGAITGMLCDKCRSVTAIEMNALRSQVIKARYPNRNNLTVLNEDINNWQTNKKFDYVVFIGVLEYAGVFSDAWNPYEEFLGNIKRLLKEDGILLFAIENRFGVKYWCGASEDHLQRPFVGIEGYTQAKTPKTFSKYELKQMLVNSGFNCSRFYNVLPDYKFPQLIFTDEFMPSYNELQKVPFTYSKGSLLTVNEAKLYKSLIENNVLNFFANSYLIEASANKLPEEHAVFISARGENKKEYKINTIIDSNENVVKQATHPNAIAHLAQTYRNNLTLKKQGLSVLDVKFTGSQINYRIYKGIKADKKFEEYLGQNDLKSLYSLIDELKTCLLKSSEISENNENIITANKVSTGNYNYGIILSCGYIDMTFYNSFYSNGKLVFFDQEWVFPNVPLDFMLYYSVKTAYQRSQVRTTIHLDNILNYLGIGEERTVYDKLEDYIWSTVLYRQGDFYGKDGYCNIFNNDILINRALEAFEELPKLKQEMLNRDGHIELLLESERQLKKELNGQVEKFDALAKEKDKAHELFMQEMNIALVSLAREKEKEVGDLHQTLANKEKEVGDLNQTLANKEKEVGDLNQALANREKEVSDLNQTLTNKEGHIDLLLESDRELQRIKGSRSWRLMGYFWKLRDIIAPFGSKRRLFIKMTVKFTKHPVCFLRKATPKRINKFFYTLKREGTASVSRHMNDCLSGPQIQHTMLEINKIEPAERKTIADYHPFFFMRVDSPLVSIIIPVFNQFDYTYNCLKSILQNSGEIPYEVIIADDGSDDLTAVIEKLVHNINVIKNKSNLRFLRNCNNASKYAKGDYILFLNNDTQVQENWLAPLIELIEHDKNIGMVGSKLVYPDGRLQEAGGIIWDDASAWNYGNRSDPNEPEYNYVKETDYISGASIMIRRSIWEKIGGFDEAFCPAYYEDTDLAFEVRKRGYKVMYQPKSVVVHFEGASNGTDLTVGQKQYQAINQNKFFEKWEKELKEDHFPNGQDVFKACDRSKNKKTILVIDHYVPHYDQDAGSRCIYMYIKLFLQMGMKVVFLGDNFYPHQPYTSELQQLGVFVLYGNYYYNNWKDWLRDNGKYFDFVYTCRAHITIKYIDLLKRFTNAKVFYFNEDMQHIREYRQYEITGDKALLIAAKGHEKMEMEISQKADVLHVVGSYEHDILSKLFPDKPVRNIPVYFFEPLKNKDYSFENRKDILFVGGFNHAPNEDGVLWFYDNVFPKLLEAYPGLKWYIVGSKPTEKVTALNSKHIIVTGYISDEQLNSYYHSCRMCVAPLRFGAGVKGKVIEAAYNQIPLLTTPIGAEGLSLEEDAFLVCPPDESFADQAVALYGDAERLVRLSENCVAFINNNFTSDCARKILEYDMDGRKEQI